MTLSLDLLCDNDSKRNEENLSENGEARGSPIRFDKATSDELFAAKFSNCSRSAYRTAGLFLTRFFLMAVMSCMALFMWVQQADAAYPGCNAIECPTVYVSESGKDWSIREGSVSKPYQTLQFAITQIVAVTPNLQGHTLTMVYEPSTGITESFNLSGLTNGFVRIQQNNSKIIRMMVVASDGNVPLVLEKIMAEKFTFGFNASNVTLQNSSICDDIYIPGSGFPGMTDKTNITIQNNIFIPFSAVSSSTYTSSSGNPYISISKNNGVVNVLDNKVSSTLLYKGIGIFVSESSGGISVKGNSSLQNVSVQKSTVDWILKNGFKQFATGVVAQDSTVSHVNENNGYNRNLVYRFTNSNLGEFKKNNNGSLIAEKTTTTGSYTVGPIVQNNLNNIVLNGVIGDSIIGNTFWGLETGSLWSGSWDASIVLDNSTLINQSISFNRTTGNVPSFLQAKNSSPNIALNIVFNEIYGDIQDAAGNQYDMFALDNTNVEVFAWNIILGSRSQHDSFLHLFNGSVFDQIAQNNMGSSDIASIIFEKTKGDFEVFEASSSVSGALPGVGGLSGGSIDHNVCNAEVCIGLANVIVDKIENNEYRSVNSFIHSYVSEIGSVNSNSIPSTEQGMNPRLSSCTFQFSATDLNELSFNVMGQKRQGLGLDGEVVCLSGGTNVGLIHGNTIVSDFTMATNPYGIVVDASTIGTIDENDFSGMYEAIDLENHSSVDFIDQNTFTGSLGDGIAIDVDSSEVSQISNSIFTSFYQEGFEHFDEDGESLGYCAEEEITFLYAISLYDVTGNLKILNNTFYNDEIGSIISSSLDESGAIIPIPRTFIGVDSSPLMTLEIFNNIFDSGDGVAMEMVAIIAYGSSGLGGIIGLDYNLYNHLDYVLGDDAVSQLLDFETVRQLYGYDMNSYNLSLDQGAVNAVGSIEWGTSPVIDLYATTPFAIDTGDGSLGIVTDSYNNARPMCHGVDIGAIENQDNEDVDNDGLCAETAGGKEWEGASDSTDDTDRDGLLDYDEIFTYETDPTNNDTDGDTLWDSQEILTYGTDPFLADTDGDGIDDGVELANDTDPLDASDYPGMDGDGDGVKDAVDACPTENAMGYDLDGDGCIDDTDGDTVTDDIDVCSGTVDYTTVDTNGCSDSQRDTDSDGVYDDVDACRLVAASPAEDLDGDGCIDAPGDGDSDGVADSLDVCPSTPMGETVDSNGCAASERDLDLDGVMDNLDACPSVAFVFGYDEDGDGCTDNDDGDDYTNDVDACVSEDSRGYDDGTGCIVDSDGDGVKDDIDLCPATTDTFGLDATGCSDSDRYTDTDGDGTYDHLDAFPTDPLEWDDTDSDGYGDNSDVFPANSLEWADSDSDKVGDNSDVCVGTPTTETADSTGCSASQLDDDGDGIMNDHDFCLSENATGYDLNSDGCIDDSDSDGVKDNLDACPSVAAVSGYDIDGNGCTDDSDGDGYTNDVDACVSEDSRGYDDGAGCIADTDGDGVKDNIDLCPATMNTFGLDATGCSDSDRYTDTDGDGVYDHLDAFPSDPTEWDDTDGDGHGDNSDVFPTNSFEWEDTDSDGVGDNSDACASTPTTEMADGAGCSISQLDDDGDGITNDVDLCLSEDATGYDLNSDGCIDDTDSDGVKDNLDVCPSVAFVLGYDIDGNGCTDDTDGDGYTDNVDIFPTDSTEWTDSDGDGYGDNYDDAFPSNPLEWSDSDSDGVGDNSDVCADTPISEAADSTGCSASQIDTDGDGMDDAFETLYGLNPLDPSDAFIDEEGDLLTNLQEYDYGTNPNAFDSSVYYSSTGAFGVTYGTGANVALGKTVTSLVYEDPTYCVARGYTADKLVDGNTATMVYPANLNMDYIIDLGGAKNLESILLYWGETFGTDPIRISGWTLSGTLADGTEIILADASSSPGVTQTLVMFNSSLQALEFTEIEIFSYSTIDWTGMMELFAYEL